MGKRVRLSKMEGSRVDLGSLPAAGGFLLGGAQGRRAVVPVLRVPREARPYRPTVDWSILAEVDLLLGEPRGVLDGLLNVLRFEVRVARQDLLDCSSMGDLTHDDRNRNPHPSDTCPPTHDPGLESDPLEFHRALSRQVSYPPWSSPYTTPRSRAPYPTEPTPNPSDGGGPPGNRWTPQPVISETPHPFGGKTP